MASNLGAYEIIANIIKLALERRELVDASVNKYFFK